MKILGDIIIAVLTVIFIFMLYKFLKTPKEDAEKRENAETNFTKAGFVLTAYLIIFKALLNFWYPLVIFALPFCALWDFIAFIIFLATLKSNEAKHKKTENMFIISSVVLTVGTALAAFAGLYG